MKSVKNYKVLYDTCAEQSVQQDSLIALLQQQLTQLISERQSLNAVIVAQQEELSHQAGIIAGQQTTLDQQLRTINGQTEKLSQQQTIIQEQHALIGSQQQELEKNKKELLHLGNLRFDMATLKKWIYGIKSEKRHQPTEPVKANIGDQLSLSMDVDSWGVCKITDRHRVPAHLRIIKSTTPKKAGGRHDFPPGLEEEITEVDVIDKPINAKCVGHVDQRQLACDPVRWYVKVTRRLVYLVYTGAWYPPVPFYDGSSSLLVKVS